MQKILLVLFGLLLFVSCKNLKNAQEQINTTSKTHTILTVKPRPFVETLPDELEENSGLFFYEGLFWTFNDSGGENKVFAIDRQGGIQHEIELEGAKNVDWEDIAQDEKHFYVGDFGNNNGMRKNQVVYAIKKKDISKKKKQKVGVEKIKFAFANQHDFSLKQRTSPFDCEALVEFNGNLYLFTKNWENQTTTSYQLPTKKGEYKIQPIDTFDVGALITGADISPDKRTLALVGYKNYLPVLWLFSDFQGDDFFGGKKTYIKMETILQAQTEGAAFLGNDTLLISCEETRAFDQQIFHIDLTRLK